MKKRLRERKNIEQVFKIIGYTEADLYFIETLLKKAHGSENVEFEEYKRNIYDQFAPHGFFAYAHLKIKTGDVEP